MAKSISPAQAVDEFTPAAWALVLKDIRLIDAEEALAQLGGEQEWVHVSHIVRRVKRIRRDRVLDFGTIPDPPANLDPDDTAAHSRWLKATTNAIADGTYRAPERVAVEGRRDVIRELGQAKSIDSALATRPLREAHAEARRELQAAAAEEKRAKDEKRAKFEAARRADIEARDAKAAPEADTTPAAEPNANVERLRTLTRKPETIEEISA
jgi:hypothetical protein